MNGLLKDDLRLILLPLRSPQPEHAAHYRAAQACWEDVWFGLYDQHRIAQPLFLDHLLRQDEAACLFYQERCVALILFRTLDFSLMNYERDSYFKEWTAEDRAALMRHGSKVFLTTFLTVHPDFRNYSRDLKFKEVLLDIMIKRFLQSDADVISGVTRRDRGINDESFKLGATLIREDVPYMGDRFRVDLVAFYRADARGSANLEVRRLCDRLWAERLDPAFAPNVRAA